VGVWGYLGVDSIVKVWYTAVQDHKVLGHLNDHKYRVQRTFKEIQIPLYLIRIRIIITF
jgi:hypothetical protein